MRSHPGFTVGLVIVVANLLMMLFGPMLAPYDPFEADPSSVRLPPSAQHIFGTDTNGMDIFSRVIYAPRIDLTIALAGTAISLIVGVVLGGYTGFWNNWLSTLVERVADLLQAFPPFVLAMALVAVTGQKIQNVIYVIAFLNIPIYLRLVRGGCDLSEEPNICGSGCLCGWVKSLGAVSPCSAQCDRLSPYTGIR